MFLRFSAPDRRQKNDFGYWIGRSYLEKKDFPAAEKTLKGLISEKEFVSVAPQDVYFDYLRSIYFQKRFYEVSFEAENGPFRADGGKISELDGWSAVNTSDWDKAGGIFSRLASGNSYDPDRIRAICDTINGRSRDVRKSPLLAGVLSAVLPGAGHLYAGNYTNAFGAFLLNAVFGSLTGYSVYRKQWGYAALFGFIEAGWYTGNIVSAYQEAGYRNAKADNDRKMALSAYFPFPVGE